MSTVQPDLFGDLDRAEAEDLAAAERAAETARLWQAPATCPSCNTTERTGYLLSSSHGYRPGEDGICGFPRFQHPIYGRHCTAQHLVTNHIRYYARHDQPEQLGERMDRGRALGLDVEAIAVSARTEASS